MFGMFRPIRPSANGPSEMSDVISMLQWKLSLHPGASDVYKESRFSGDGISYSCSWTPPSPGIPGKESPHHKWGHQKESWPDIIYVLCTVYTDFLDTATLQSSHFTLWHHLGILSSLLGKLLYKSSFSVEASVPRARKMFATCYCCCRWCWGTIRQ